VYALCTATPWLWHREIERKYITFCFWVMVQLMGRKRKMRTDTGNYYEKLGLNKISFRSQFTIHNSAGWSPDPEGQKTDTWFSKPNLSSRTANFACLVILSISFSSPSAISLFVVYNSTIITEQKATWCFTISLCNGHNLTPIAAWHQVQRTPSAAYTERSIYLRLSVAHSFPRLRLDPLM